MTVLDKKNKKIRFEKDNKSKNYKRDDRKKKDKAYMVNNNTFEYQYLSSFSKDKLYAGIGDEDESINYVYNELFYTSVFSHRNIVFNTKINKFNIYKLRLKKTPISDIYIYKSDLNRITYSGIKTNPNTII